MRTRIVSELILAAVGLLGVLPRAASAGLIPLRASSTITVSFEVDDSLDGLGNPRVVTRIGPQPFPAFPASVDLAPTFDTPGTSADTDLTWGRVPFPSFDQEFVRLTAPTFLVQPVGTRALAELKIDFSVQFQVDVFGNGNHTTVGFYRLIVNVLPNLPGDPALFALVEASAQYSDTGGVILDGTTLGGTDLTYSQNFVGGPFVADRLNFVNIPALPPGDIMTITGSVRFRGDPASMSFDFSARQPGFGSPVPEPSTLALLPLGLLMLLMRRRVWHGTTGR